MSHSVQPQPIQIVQINENQQITCDINVLKRFLEIPKIKDKNISVISITGIFRQGKSFLLNFLLRYLNLKYKKQRFIGEKWLNQDDGNLTGFEWKYGKERQTIGILMWSEIFIAELPSGDEVAIILLDTQGTSDTKTTIQNSATIFAISTLISSVQIYNIMKQIDQSDLEHMEFFSGYAQMAANNSNRTPFQDVCFLIRDWQCPYDNPYGATGGQEYLNDFLNDEDQPDEIKRQNANIKRLFKNRKCFLLPHPGEKVSTGRSFRGELRDIDGDFLYHVEQLAPFLLSPEKLVPKRINGEKIKVGDLVHFIQSYCEFFVNGTVPNFESIYLATATAQYKAFLVEVTKRYKIKMDFVINEQTAVLKESDLNQIHEQNSEELLQYMRWKNIMGPEDMKEEYETKLKQSLDELFCEYRKLNKVKSEMRKEVGRVNEQLVQTEQQLRNFEELIKAQQKEIQETEEKGEKLADNVKKLQQQIENAESSGKRGWLSAIPWVASAGLGALGAWGLFYRKTDDEDYSSEEDY